MPIGEREVRVNVVNAVSWALGRLLLSKVDNVDKTAQRLEVYGN